MAGIRLSDVKPQLVATSGGGGGTLQTLMSNNSSVDEEMKELQRQKLKLQMATLQSQSIRDAAQFELNKKKIESLMNNDNERLRLDREKIENAQKEQDAKYRGIIEGSILGSGISEAPEMTSIKINVPDKENKKYEFDTDTFMKWYDKNRDNLEQKAINNKLSKKELEILQSYDSAKKIQDPLTRRKKLLELDKKFFATDENGNAVPVAKSEMDIIKNKVGKFIVENKMLFNPALELATNQGKKLILSLKDKYDKLSETEEEKIARLEKEKASTGIEPGVMTLKELRNKRLLDIKRKKNQNDRIRSMNNEAIEKINKMVEKNESYKIPLKEKTIEVTESPKTFIPKINKLANEAILKVQQDKNKTLAEKANAISTIESIKQKRIENYRSNYKSYLDNSKEKNKRAFEIEKIRLKDELDKKRIRYKQALKNKSNSKIDRLKAQKLRKEISKIDAQIKKINEELD